MTWTKEIPKEQGRYWYWEGSVETTPINLGVMWSPFGCFVHGGQMGIEEAYYCSNEKGWWYFDEEPELPK